MVCSRVECQQAAQSVLVLNTLVTRMICSQRLMMLTSLARIVKEKQGTDPERGCPQSRQLPLADLRGVRGKLGGWPGNSLF